MRCGNPTPTGRKRCAASRPGIRPGVDVAAFEAASRATTFAPREGLPGRVWASGEPAWIADVLADENFPRAEAARRAGLSAAFCFPVRSARGVLGVIEFLTAEPRGLDAELLATMANLGDQIGQALERRRDAESLRAKEARHRAMLEASLDCVVTMGHDGRIIDFNPAAERTFGHRAADVIGREMADVIIPPDLRARHREGLQRYLETEAPKILDRRLELTAVRADGTVFPVELTITRIDVPGPPTFTGLPARHHRAQGGRGGAAGGARAPRRGGRRRAAPHRARSPRRRAAAARRAVARPAHGPLALRRGAGRGPRAARVGDRGSDRRRSASCASSRTASTRRS